MFNDGEWVTLTDCLRTKDFVALDMNSTKDELELGVAAPDYFIGGTMAYDGGWTIANQTAYDDSYAEQLATAKENKQNSLDASCSSYIYSYWSAEAQSNVALGLYEQSICELCKSEISDVLSENVTYVEAVEAMTDINVVNSYNPPKTVITGGN